MLDQRVAVGLFARQVRHHVRHQLEPLDRSVHRQPAKLTERRDVAVRAARQQRPGRGFLQPADVARHREAKRIGLRRVESQLRKRNPELGRPAVLIARDAHVPHRIPAVIAAVVVEPVAIHLDAGRVDAELVRGAPVVVGVDQHAHPVAGRFVVAASEVGDDLAWLGIVGADLDEEGGRVVRDSKLGALARLAAIVRLALHEAAGRRYRLPHRRIQLAGDADGIGRGRQCDGVDPRRRCRPRRLPRARGQASRRAFVPGEFRRPADVDGWSFDWPLGKKSQAARSGQAALTAREH